MLKSKGLHQKKVNLICLHKTCHCFDFLFFGIVKGPETASGGVKNIPHSFRLAFLNFINWLEMEEVGTQGFVVREEET